MKSQSSLIAIALLVLSAVLYSGVIGPLSASLEKSRAELSDEEIQLSKIEMEVTQRADIKSRIARLEATNAVNRTVLIAPMLNSYAMRVKSLVDRFATESGLVNVEYDEGTLRALPMPREQVPERRTARRSVRLKASADYAAAVSFLLRLERECPLMTLQSLSIKPGSGYDSAEHQDVEMVLEWPCEGVVIR